MTNKYTFEIEIKENGEKGINQEPWITTDVTLAENEKQALINIDEENDRLGYKILRAKLIESEPFDDED